MKHKNGSSEATAPEVSGKEVRASVREFPDGCSYLLRLDGKVIPYDSACTVEEALRSIGFSGKVSPKITIHTDRVLFLPDVPAIRNSGFRPLFLSAGIKVTENDHFTVTMPEERTLLVFATPCCFSEENGNSPHRLRFIHPLHRMIRLSGKRKMSVMLAEDGFIYSAIRQEGMLLSAEAFAVSSVADMAFLTERLLERTASSGISICIGSETDISFRDWLKRRSDGSSSINIEDFGGNTSRLLYK